MFYDVPGYEAHYQISVSGAARTKPRYVNSPICGGRRLLPARPLKTRLIKGYPSFAICVESKRATIYVHRALAQLFIPNPDNKPNINHRDGNKENFELSNLEWCTHLENMRHAYKTGLAVARENGPGEASPAAKLNDEKVRTIRRRLLAGETYASLAREFNVSNGTIGFIARGETWSHIL